ncbi:Isochorismatase hydrolase [Pseudovirgaria hyperparasitica]|uniref:Isochorismatase hydrolase n=1 Tax=Pseudovirgaria hyperparasitica TaxID=470096 RepID=A0A6A6WM38_9PEZI|nr:Isochorismatase hydrolase [Pseudovirgaria hyperparasitica]KAF2763265.1 Isochorismatase hydrolase [Pseudovirgaria hyperparasitica]
MSRRLLNPIIFICDLQEKFRPAIHEFAKVVTTTQKVLRASQALNIPVVASTQNRARLGETVPDLKLDSKDADGIPTIAHVDKTLFSMWTPEVQAAVSSLPNSKSGQKHEVVIVGIESHICVTQTTLDLLAAGHKVYVLADGVSSVNREEVPIALARLRSAGATVTTSESWIYECMGDAGIAEFKTIAKLVKETGTSTKDVLQTLCKF